MWEAMHGEMTGYYEVRVSGPGQEHFRVFCLLDRDGPGLDEPAIVVLTGLRKPFMTKLRRSDYRAVRRPRRRVQGDLASSYRYLI
jgi:hypothetical protein